MKFAILVYPGSNCDHDCYHVIKHVLGQEVEYLWHKDLSFKGFDCLVLPGGFSYGDYLRPGAIASYSPITSAIKKFAEAGGLVIGICNGFQVLCESGLLPGALIRNKALKFICKSVPLKVENSETRFTSAYEKDQVISVPIAHADGCFFAASDTIKRIEDNRQVLLRYCAPDGGITDEANPNGSLNNIAGIINEKGNVVGMMPHPERASEDELGSIDGRGVFESIIRAL